MKYLSSKEIRNIWLNYFKKQDHEIISSSSLIPHDDPTLLWINAGVAPLKKFFAGLVKPNNPRMTNIQKCIRTNDIENVGNTGRHHTFFEMMGNFSIGDYFKEEAIKMAYDLLLSENNFNIPLEKLYFTYYPTDKDTYNYWLNLGIPSERLISSENNYWEIGPGPSGPCTEVFFDRGEEYDTRGVELIKDDIENERYIEIWNIVFSQYDAEPNKKRSEYSELPHKNIDTGAGFERFASVFQNTKTNFETDLFLPIINEISKLSNVEYSGQTSFKVIADHIKAVVFALSDGAIFSNEGRGYVLRRLIRRAMKHGRGLGLLKPFLNDLVGIIIEIYGEFYPNLIEMKNIITELILTEEENFIKTIASGEKLIEEYILKYQNIPSEIAFRLYDTYGFPIELTEEYANEHNLAIDMERFNQLLEEQKEKSRKAMSFTQGMSNQNEEYLNFDKPSKFIGYNTLTSTSKVIGIFKDGVVFDQTPFYATKGGQNHDLGKANDLLVTDVIEMPNGQYLHLIPNHKFKLNDLVKLSVDQKIREDILKNHTATHLLHQAIKDVLGKHSNQQGSYLDQNILRFDINHYQAINNDEILKIEKEVNEKINEAINVETIETTYDEAIKLGSTALFTEEYGDNVRVVKIGDYSIELCGGTHLKNTKDINNFVITNVESIGSGIHRFSAITNVDNDKLSNQLHNYEATINTIINKIVNEYNYDKKNLLDKPQLKLSYQDIINYRNYIEELQEVSKKAFKEYERTLANAVLKNIDELIPLELSDKMVITVDNIPNQVLKQVIDTMFDKIKGQTLLLFNITNDKVTYLAKSNTGNAGEIVKKVNELTNGRGGGKETFAQGGTQDLDAFYQNLPFIQDIIND